MQPKALRNVYHSGQKPEMGDTVHLINTPFSGTVVGDTLTGWVTVQYRDRTVSQHASQLGLVSRT